MLLTLAVAAGSCASGQTALKARSDKQDSPSSYDKDRNAVPALLYQRYSVTNGPT